MTAAAAGYGVYVHVPFCARRCDYCAFAAWDDRWDVVDTYMAALRREVDDAVRHDLPAATSIFVGGGTPSAVPASALCDVLEAIPRTPGCEITVECNPDTVTESLLSSYVAAGVNRVSLGVQSMVPHVLASLGRTHTMANVTTSVAMARAAGVGSVNLDLIYGAVGESDDDWRHTLEAVLDLAPDHVSAYALTVEPGTTLAFDRTRHPDDDTQADRYRIADHLLGAAGLEWYEISNWARPDHECRHNQLTWAGGNYRGFGCAAHSHQDGRRWWNVRTPDRYASLVARGESVVAGAEELDDEARRLEALHLAVRTRRGVPVDALPAGERAVLAPLVVEDGGGLSLTVEGRLLANEVAVRLR
ncbi:MAG: radical SAM family heme chaperone HemW [Acidimicrobiia bacterium]|nr:radical SAM family heme chaperone HemW [Acidimicrobiia bacterium]